MDSAVLNHCVKLDLKANHMVRAALALDLELDLDLLDKEPMVSSRLVVSLTLTANLV